MREQIGTETDLVNVVNRRKCQPFSHMVRDQDLSCVLSTYAIYMLYAIANPSVCRLSVVCNVCAPYSAISYLIHPLQFDLHAKFYRDRPNHRNYTKFGQDKTVTCFELERFLFVYFMLFAVTHRRSQRVYLHPQGG